MATPPPYDNSELTTVELLMRNHQFIKAEALLTEFTEASPRNAYGWLMLGVSRVRLGYHKLAIVCFEKAEKLDIRDIGLYMNHAYALFMVGQKKTAIDVLSNGLLLTDTVNTEGIATAKGYLAYWQGNYKEAESQLRMAYLISSNNNESGLASALSDVLMKLGKYKESLEILQDLTKNLQYNTTDQIRMGIVEWQLGNREVARRIMLDVLEKDTNNVGALRSMAHFSMYSFRVKDALHYLALFVASEKTRR